MSNPSSPQQHIVLQFAGGGSLTVAQIVKAAVLEKITGKRIHDLGQSFIADSGGVIALFCLHKMPAPDFLVTYLQHIRAALPTTRFLATQSLSLKPRPFDNSALESTLRETLGTTTIADIKGNVFIGCASVNGDIGRFEKYDDGKTTQFRGLIHDTKLADIALAATAIPGIMPVSANGHIDTLSDQNPSPIFAKLQKFVSHPIRYIQIGTVQCEVLAENLITTGFLGSAITGKFGSYVAQNKRNAHLRDAAEVLDGTGGSVASLTTYSEHLFRQTNNSPEQRTLLVKTILEDIEARHKDYAAIAKMLTGSDGLAMSVETAVEQIRNLVDPFMVKEKVINRGQEIQIERTFPTPTVIPETETLSYKSGYWLGCQAAKLYEWTSKRIVTPFFNRLSANCNFPVPPLENQESGAPSFEHLNHTPK